MFLAYGESEDVDVKSYVHTRPVVSSYIDEIFIGAPSNFWFQLKDMCNTLNWRRGKLELVQEGYCGEFYDEN